MSKKKLKRDFYDIISALPIDSVQISQKMPNPNGHGMRGQKQGSDPVRYGITDEVLKGMHVTGS